MAHREGGVMEATVLETQRKLKKAQAKLQKAHEKHRLAYETLVQRVLIDMRREQLPPSVIAYEERIGVEKIYYVTFYNGVEYVNFNGSRSVIYNSRDYQLDNLLVFYHPDSQPMGCDNVDVIYNLLGDLKIVDEFCMNQFFSSFKDRQVASDLAARRASELVLAEEAKERKK